MKNDDIDQWRKVRRTYVLVQLVAHRQFQHLVIQLYTIFCHLQAKESIRLTDSLSPTSLCLYARPQRVEMASELAVSEVFCPKKPHSGARNLAVPLQSSDQLRDHDDAYGEGRLSHEKNNRLVSGEELPI